MASNGSATRRRTRAPSGVHLVEVLMTHSDQCLLVFCRHRLTAVSRFPVAISKIACFLLACISARYSRFLYLYILKSVIRMSVRYWKVSVIFLGSTTVKMA